MYDKGPFELMPPAIQPDNFAKVKFDRFATQLSRGAESRRGCSVTSHCLQISRNFPSSLSQSGLSVTSVRKSSLPPGAKVIYATPYSTPVFEIPYCQRVLVGDECVAAQDKGLPCMKDVLPAECNSCSTCHRKCSCGTILYIGFDFVDSHSTHIGTSVWDALIRKVVYVSGIGRSGHGLFTEVGPALMSIASDASSGHCENACKAGGTVPLSPGNQAKIEDSPPPRSSRGGYAPVSAPAPTAAPVHPPAPFTYPGGPPTRNVAPTVPAIPPIPYPGVPAIPSVAPISPPKPIVYPEAPKAVRIGPPAPAVAPSSFPAPAIQPRQNNLPGFTISHPDGRAWKVEGSTLRLNSGGTIRLEIYAGSDVYNAQTGRVALFQNGDRNLAVRHMGFVMYTHKFEPNNFDFAWRLVKSGSGIQLYNDYGGGHWVGYDNTRDVILIVEPNDRRRVSWTFDPIPAMKYVEVSQEKTKKQEPRYYAQCDPTKTQHDSAFTLCMFRSDIGLSSIPNIAGADSSNSRLHYVGQGSISNINFNSYDQFRKIVSGIPSADYAWAIFGKININAIGAYRLCISSDDG